MYNILKEVESMNLDYFIYNESDKISFKSTQSNYITFYGEMNDYLIKNIMLINENDYVTLNFSKASKKNITKYYKLIRLSSYNFINTEHAETVMDELAFPLESLGMKKDRIAADTKQKIDDRFKLLKIAIDLQYEAIEKNNGTKLFNFLIGQLDNALIHINRFTKVRKQQIKEAWTDACIQETRKVLSNHFIIGDIVRTTIKVAAHLRRKEIDKSSRTEVLKENYDYETASR